MKTKVCSKCGLEKDIDEFSKHKSKRDGLRSYCKTCQSRKNRNYKTGDYFLVTRFGINHLDYNSLFNKQEGKCAICGTPQSNIKKSLAVDHDHKTGRIRGLLCSNCNVAIGLFKDDLEVLQKAIIYLSTI